MKQTLQFVILFVIAIVFPLTGWAEEQGYAVLDTENGILTFKYGELPEGDNVFQIDNGAKWLGEYETVGYGIQYPQARKIKKVVFDQSFSKARPKSTAVWFMDMMNLTEIYGIEYLNTSQVTNMTSMFDLCENLTKLDVSHFDTRNVTNMCQMFSRCEKVTYLDVSKFNTSKVVNMMNMFGGCASLENIDVRGFDVSNVTNMSGMFTGCKKISTLDISKFDTRNVTSMSNMFSACESLKDLNVSSFNTSNVTDMSGMFSECRSLTNLDVSSLNTSKVTSMKYIFYLCDNLTTLDISCFNTSNVTSMAEMFHYCDKLETLILGKEFNTDKCNDQLFPYHLYNLQTISFTGDLPRLNENTFKTCGNSVYPVTLNVPSQYLENYALKTEPYGVNNIVLFYGGYFKLAGYTVDTSMPEPNVGTKRLIAITRQREGNNLERTDMTYDEKGRIVNLVYSNGTRTKVGNYKYDNDVISIVYDNSFKHEYHFVNGKVSTAPMNLESEGVTGTRIFEYDASDQLRKFTIVTDGSTNNKYAKIEWDNGSPSNISYGSLNTSTNTEKEMYNATFTQNGMTAEPVTLALFGMCFGKPTFDISDDIYESIAFYPYIGRLPQKLIGQTDYKQSGKISVYNYSYETDSSGNITKVTITCEGKATVYTLEWEGSSTTPVTPPSTDITASDTGKQDFGSDGGIDGNTNLDGNVVGNVFYNIASSSGSYNAVEGCIEITNPTADDDIEGKDIFGEDFKNHFTGIVFKVAAGKGTITVNAQTVGSMMLKVKVGSNEPYEMMLTGKTEAKFSYNVTEPTYIYIYASSFSASVANSAGENSALKIYGFSWDDTTGIDEVITDISNNTPIYNLHGQRLAAPQKGINIIGGKKVVVK